MERYHILAPAVELIFFFFCRKNICLSALQRNSHQDTQRRGTQRKVAEEEESKLTECSIKNAHLRYMSQEHLGETIGIFLSFFHFKTGQQVQHHRKHQAKKRLQVCLWAIRFQSDNKGTAALCQQDSKDTQRLPEPFMSGSRSLALSPVLLQL